MDKKLHFNEYAKFYDLVYKKKILIKKYYLLKRN